MINTGNCRCINIYKPTCLVAFSCRESHFTSSRWLTPAFSMTGCLNFATIILCHVGDAKCNTSVIQVVGNAIRDPVFKYVTSYICGYKWSMFQVQFSSIVTAGQHVRANDFFKSWARWSPLSFSPPVSGYLQFLLQLFELWCAWNFDVIGNLKGDTWKCY